MAQNGSVMLRGTRHAVVLGLVAVIVGGCGSAADPDAAPPPQSAASGPAANDPATSDPGAGGAGASPAPTTPTRRPSESPRATPDTPGAPTPSTTPSEKPSAGSDGVLRQGESGPEIVALQQRLAELGYWNGTADGEFGQLTTQAVYALQKAAGIGRDGTVGPKTRKAVDQGVRPKAKSRDGHRVEIDLNRQLLMIVDNGRVTKIFNTSTGSNEHYQHDGNTYLASTPRGKFTVSRQIDGWRHAPLGELYRPKYFNGGIAVHGSYSIPPYPASHGCARLSIAAMDWLWKSGEVPVGTSVWVY